MPLSIAALLSGLPGANGADYPETFDGCARAWADAITGWAAGVVPASLTVTTAAAALEPLLLAAFVARDLGAVDDALAAFAAEVALGMAPTFTGIPPPVGPGLAAVLADARPATRDEGVLLVATTLDNWLRTGTATLVAPPNTLVPAWS